MKIKDYLRQYIPVVTISMVLITSTLEAGAEGHQNKGKSGKDHDRQEYLQSNRNNERFGNNEWHGRKDRNRDDWKSECRDCRNDYHPQYSKKKSHAKPTYYNHPKYGRIYNRFEYNPMVFRTQCGDYYYSGHNFYRYHDGIGYCIVEPPRTQYFSYLPVECHKVYINDHVFFRNGDLFFERSPKGYVLVPSPLEIHFSVRF